MPKWHFSQTWLRSGTAWSSSTYSACHLWLSTSFCYRKVSLRRALSYQTTSKSYLIDRIHLNRVSFCANVLRMSSKTYTSWESKLTPSQQRPATARKSCALSPQLRTSAKRHKNLQMRAVALTLDQSRAARSTGNLTNVTIPQIHESILALCIQSSITCAALMTASWSACPRISRHSTACTSILTSNSSIGTQMHQTLNDCSFLKSNWSSSKWLRTLQTTLWRLSIARQSTWVAIMTPQQSCRCPQLIVLSSRSQI